MNINNLKNENVKLYKIIIGFFTTNILKRFSLRKVGLMGAFIFVLGTFSTIFTKTIHYLVFSIGILEGKNYSHLKNDIY